MHAVNTHIAVTAESKAPTKPKTSNGKDAKPATKVASIFAKPTPAAAKQPTATSSKTKVDAKVDESTKAAEDGSSDSSTAEDDDDEDDSDDEELEGEAAATLYVFLNYVTHSLLIALVVLRRSSLAKSRKSLIDRLWASSLNGLKANRKPCVAFSEGRANSGFSVPYAALVYTLQLIEGTTKRLEIAAYLTSFLVQVIERTPDELLKVVYLCINRVSDTTYISMILS